MLRWFGRGLLTHAGEKDRGTVGKFDDQGEFAAYSLNVVAKGGKIKIRALLNTRHAFLADFEFAGEAGLGEFAEAAQLAEVEFFGDEFGSALLDAAASFFRKRSHDGFKRNAHLLFRLPSSLARWFR